MSLKMRINFRVEDQDRINRTACFVELARQEIQAAERELNGLDAIQHAGAIDEALSAIEPLLAFEGR